MQTSLNLSPDQVSALQPAFTQMKQQRQSEHEAFKGKLQAVLTPDQQAKLKSMHHGHHKHEGQQKMQQQ